MKTKRNTAHTPKANRRSARNSRTTKQARDARDRRIIRRFLQEKDAEFERVNFGVDVFDF